MCSYRHGLGVTESSCLDTSTKVSKCFFGAFKHPSTQPPFFIPLGTGLVLGCGEPGGAQLRLVNVNNIMKIKMTQHFEPGLCL